MARRDDGVRAPRVSSTGEAGIHRQLRALRRITTALTHPEDLEGILQLIAEEAIGLCSAGCACVSILEGDVLRVRLATGEMAEHYGDMLPLGESLVGRAVLERTPQWSENVLEDPRAYRPRERRTGVGPVLALPLSIEDRVLGALLLARNPEEPLFGEADAVDLLPFAETAGVALENARLHEEVKRSGEALRERAIALSSLQESVLVFDREGTITYVNQAAERLYRAPPGGLLGRNIAEMLAPGSPGPSFSKLQARVLEGESWSGEVWDQRLNGSPMPLALRMAPLRDESGEVYGWVETALDLTEQKAGEAERERLTRLATVGEITLALRHEINNPLAAILTHAQLLQEEPALDALPEARASLNDIVGQGERIRDLVRRLENLHDPRSVPYLGTSRMIDLSADDASDTPPS